MEGKRVSPHWREVVQQAVDARRAPLDALWARRTAADVATIEADLRTILAACARAVLDTLYPGRAHRARSLIMGGVVPEVRIALYTGSARRSQVKSSASQPAAVAATSASYAAPPVTPH